MSPDVDMLLEEAWGKRRESQYDEARTLLNTAREQCGEEDYDALGRISHISMQLDRDLGKLSEALELCRRSLSYYQRTHNPDRIAHSTRHLADLLRQLDEDEESERCYRKAIGIYRDDPGQQAANLANALRGLALVLEKRRNIEEAINAWREAKSLYKSLRITSGVDEANEKLMALSD